MRHGGQHRRCHKRSRHSSTPVWGASTKSNGKRRSKMNICGCERDRNQILRRKWGWIGHTFRKPASSTTRQALTWNIEGKRKRGRPGNSWRRDTEAELKQQRTNWFGMTRTSRTECDGEGSLMAYARPGAMGISK